MDYRRTQKAKTVEQDVNCTFHTVSPNRWTFQSDKIREWVENWMAGKVLNACAGKTQLQHQGEIVRNDLNENMPDLDSGVDVVEISDHYKNNSFDTVIFDPPFSDNQADKQYGGINISDHAKAIKEFDQVLRSGGRIIQFGFSASCTTAAMPYRKKEVAVFNTLGRQNDWIATVDMRIDGKLSQIFKEETVGGAEK